MLLDSPASRWRAPWILTQTAREEAMYGVPPNVILGFRGLGFRVAFWGLQKEHKRFSRILDQSYRSMIARAALWHTYADLLGSCCFRYRRTTKPESTVPMPARAFMLRFASG